MVKTKDILDKYIYLDGLSDKILISKLQDSGYSPTQESSKISIVYNLLVIEFGTISVHVAFGEL